MRRIPIIVTTVLIWCVWTGSVSAQSAAPTITAPKAQPAVPAITAPQESKPAGAPVIFDDEKLFVVYDKIGSFTPQERARAISDRISRLADDPFTRIYPITAVEQDSASAVVYGELVIMTVTDRDAEPAGKSRQDLAKEYAQKIQGKLADSHELSSFRTIIIDIALALLDTALLIGLLVLLKKTSPKIYAKIDAWRESGLQPIKVQRIELLSVDQVSAGLTGAVEIIRAAVTLALLYVYLTTVLGIFPWTRGISASLVEAVLSTLQTIGEAFLTNIPDVISIAVIVVVTGYILKMIHLAFDGIERGALSFSGFHREWAQPTYRIVRFFVLVFSAVAIFPYIPGSHSEAFRGISVFLGILVSLAAAGSFSNIVAGVVLTYMRPFSIGDRVKIADTVGDITEKSLLATRVRTVKNVDITIPNALVLNSHIINFSTSSMSPPPLILHTSVTIGYDIPWRKVHELLIAAAKQTGHILEEPEPFVLQTSLDDFFVTYEINGYTGHPHKMATICAELCQNIQDKFNEAGIEILSPHYAQIRDGHKSTLPPQYLPKAYQPPGLRITPLGSWTTQPQDDGPSKGETRP